MEWRGHPLGKKSHPAGVDIAERRHLEEQMRQAQKMESIGNFAGGVAHDFNNILSVVLGSAEMIRSYQGDDPQVRTHVDLIIESAERAAALTRSLLAFCRKEPMQPREEDLSSLTRNLEKFLRRVIGEDIRLDIVVPPEPVTIVIDKAQFEQVIINMAANARDAMATGGRLQIVLTRRSVVLHPGGGEVEAAEITIADTGTGMDEETAGRVFEPFFTTKKVGGGTGMGLAVVYGIVTQNSGTIEVSSTPGAGTTFTIRFPVVGKREERAEPQPPALSGGAETVLLVEDEPAVRRNVQLILEHFGYKVIEAENGAAAVEQFVRHREEIDLVIMDVIMPEKNGRHAADAILKLAPATKILFVSGYTSDIIDAHGDFDFDMLLIKPIHPNQLLEKMRAVLDAQQNPSPPCPSP